MSNSIQAIIFDIGGTLRYNKPVPLPEQLKLVGQIASLLDSDIPPDDLLARLNERREGYLRWSRQTRIELDEVGQWTEWFLPDWPRDLVTKQALQLNRLWRQVTARRDPFPDAKEVVQELFNRGYRLGIVSNTVSSTEVPELLDRLGISGCFEVVILSCVVGIRKPDPALLLEAVQRMEIEPEHCAYVGDQIDRDIESSRKAGFSKSILRLEPGCNKPLNMDPARTPHHTIEVLTDLLDLFPGVIGQPTPSVVYQASLSTMWAEKFPSLSEFAEGARRMGFKSVELNHQIDSMMLEKVDLSKLDISSVHEPCPADIPTWELKKRDWLLSSFDGQSRSEGVRSIKRSIDLAAAQGAGVIVIHAGAVLTDLSLENQLREMVGAGLEGTQAYQEIKLEMITQRIQLAEPCLEAVTAGLKELLEYADSAGVQLGLENRYHYYDIPSLDEMEFLLEMAPPEKLGFIYDVGHAQTLDRLGFFPHEEWLRRFSGRMIGIHFHDVRGVVDHYAPGLGEIDFAMIAPYLPANAFRTLEVKPINSSEQVRDALKYLTKHDCIQELKEAIRS